MPWAEHRAYPEDTSQQVHGLVIKLTRIDGTEFYLNPDLIEVLEASHDTHVTLTNGHRYVCAEPPDTIVERVAEFRRMSIGALRRVG